MVTDNFDLYRVRDYLSDNPDCVVIMISNKRTTSEECWGRIKGHLNIKKIPRIVTNWEHSVDGLPFHDSLILKVGRWWENKNAPHVMKWSKLAKMALPITFIPPLRRGGDDDKN